jgi:FtsZ-binding cell division protein ZapB
MKNINHNETNAIVFKCDFCEIVQEFTVLSFMKHLDKFHTDISKESQIETIKKLSFEISETKKQDKIHQQETIKKSKSYIRKRKARLEKSKKNKVTKSKPSAFSQGLPKHKASKTFTDPKPYAKIIYTPMGNKR